ncbi:PLD nuclease N-terminal domain-containing protein [Actinosynnema sp. NPDC023587]|uniref:PLD nuclease N-terminal domain-containing protein n=1 Tax=Actinosynnema sp. NPDC023587 TaxID=3154695 RepID=UPI0033C17A0A
MIMVLAQDNADSTSVTIAVFLLFLALLHVALWVAAFISVMRQDRLTGGGKFLWIVVIFGFPFLGSLGWFIFGRNAQLVKATSA